MERGTFPPKSRVASVETTGRAAARMTSAKMRQRSSSRNRFSIFALRLVRAAMIFKKRSVLNGTLMTRLRCHRWMMIGAASAAKP